MKTLTNSGDFTGSRIRISSDVCLVILSTVFSTILAKGNGEPQKALENADSQSPSVIMKSHTVTRFKIISG
jgi:hypothetical protein